MPITTLSDIRLDEESLPDAVLSSSQQLYSPTAPHPPKSELGWRDRWWIGGKPSQCVSIHYWLFAQPEQALEAAELGRHRLSARRIIIDGKSEPLYQRLAAAPCGDVCWQAIQNILFVRDNVLVLVAESGQKVSLGKMLSIANRIDTKIAQSCCKLAYGDPIHQTLP